jgi:hypothetical protein
VDYVESVRDKLRSQSSAANSERNTGGHPHGPDLPEIDAVEFSFVLDYSGDGSRYFVLHGAQVLLIGPARHNDPDVWGDDDALGEQFIEVALRLKERYGARLLDLVPTPRAEEMLNKGNWGFSWSQDRGRSIVQRRSAPSRASEERIEIIGRMLELADARYPVEWVIAERVRFANSLGGHTHWPSDDELPTQHLLPLEAEPPDIDTEKFSLVFDYSNDGSSYFVFYGDQVILSGPAEHDVTRTAKDVALRQQFIKIARKLKKKYGARLVDLVATQKAKSLLTPLHAWIVSMIGS